MTDTDTAVRALKRIARFSHHGGVECPNVTLAQDTLDQLRHDSPIGDNVMQQLDRVHLAMEQARDMLRKADTVRDAHSQGLNEARELMRMAERALTDAIFDLEGGSNAKG